MNIDYSKRIFGLDIMRAIAILLVVFSHFLWLLQDTNIIVSEVLSLAGFLGVEIFFVLSGFLIGRIVYRIFTNDDFNFNKLKYFWIRRWFRTLPNYYLVLIFNIILALILGFQLPKNIWLYALFLQNFAWEIPLFFTESWSLPIEEFAYIVGPLLLYSILMLRFNINRSKLFLYTTICVISFFTISKIIYNGYVLNSDLQFWNVNLKSVTIFRIDAIYYGMLAAYLSIVKPNFWNQNRLLLFFIGVVIFIGLNILISELQLTIENYPFFWNVLYLPINSIAIAFSLPLFAHIRSAPKILLIPVTHISLISYSMYLLHYSIILQLVKQILPNGVLSNAEIVLYASIYFFATILFAYLLYRLFEKPMMDIRDKASIKNRFY